MEKEQYVSFEVAKLLKEKGFDEECHHVYEGEDIEWANILYGEDVLSNSNDVISAPTQQMAMRWLREDKNIFIEISTSIDLNGRYHYSCFILDKECKYLRKGYTDFDWTYEDAVEAALKYCLKNLI